MRSEFLPIGLIGLLLGLVFLPLAVQGQTQEGTTGEVPAANLTGILSGQLPQDSWQVYQWESFPDVYIIHFENYMLQGQALNRVATYCEKVGTRGRILSDRQLAYYLRQNNYSVENLYGAHDYRTSDLARFHNASADAGIELNETERSLRDSLVACGLLRREAASGRWQSTGEHAVLSFATRYLGSERPSSQLLGQPDRQFEALALYHETRHGLYFTEREYARKCREYWNGVLGSDDRHAFRLVLLANDYDPADEELMINEWQAYLLTPPHEYVGRTALTGGLRRIASGRWRPRGLSYTELQLIKNHGEGLAADIEDWMAEDLRQWLGDEWNEPAGGAVQSF